MPNPRRQCQQTMPVCPFGTSNVRVNQPFAAWQRTTGLSFGSLTSAAFQKRSFPRADRRLSRQRRSTPFGTVRVLQNGTSPESTFER